MSEIPRDGGGRGPGPKRIPPSPAALRRTDLFLRARAGATHLFTDLAEDLGGVLRRRLWCDPCTQALCGNASDMDDVLQETFLRLWEHRDAFDPALGTIDALAGVIARNAAVGVLRRRSRAASGGARLEAVADWRSPAPRQPWRRPRPARRWRPRSWPGRPNATRRPAPLELRPAGRTELRRREPGDRGAGGHGRRLGSQVSPDAAGPRASWLYRSLPRSAPAAPPAWARRGIKR